jgi:hypothetical protein
MVVTLRPHPVAAAAAPVYYEIETDRHLQAVGQNAQLLVSVQNAASVPAGATLTVAGLEFTFHTAASGYDALNPSHIALEPLAANVGLAERIYAAFLAHPAALGLFSSGLPTPIGGGITLAITLNTPAPAPGPTQATDAGGAVYPQSALSPLWAVQVQAGVAHTPREGYAVTLHPWLEDHYRGSEDFRPLPALRLAVPQPGVAGAQPYTFRLEDTLRPYLGFNLPQPGYLGPQLAPDVVRRGWVQFSEAYFENGQLVQNRRLLDEHPTPPQRYEFLVLDARWPEYEHLLQPTGNCPTGPETYPDPLRPYTADNAGQLLRWLTRSPRKRIPHGAMDYLCVFAPYLHPGFDSNVQQLLRFRTPQTTVVAPLPGSLLNCYNAPRPDEQVWMIPLEGFWPESILAPGNSVCVELVFSPDGQRYVPITEQLELQIEPACPSGHTLLFQNALGVPECLHLAPRTEHRLDTRRRTAGAALNRVPSPGWPTTVAQTVVWEATTEAEFRLQTQPLSALELPSAEDLLASRYVYLLQPEAQLQGACNAKREQPFRWLPVVLQNTEYTLEPGNGSRLPQLDLTARAGRGTL